MTEQELIKKLEEIKDYIKPSQEEYEKGLNLFLQKVDAKFSQPVENEKVKEIYKLPSLVFESFTQTLVQTREFMYGALRLYSSHIFASVLVTVLVFGAFGAYSGISARKALPDNRPLYTLKRALEKTQLTLSFTSSQRSAVRINHLERRVEELNHIVAITKANPQHDGVAVFKAIRDTQYSLNAVKDDLLAVAENETSEEIAELKELVGQRVSRYQIALSDVHEDLPDDIKNELEPEMAALTTAIFEINEVIEQLDIKEANAESEAENPFVMETATSGTVIIMSTSSSSTITTTATMIDGVDVSETISTEIQPTYIPPVPVEEPFSLEKDTFNVRIGD